LGKFEGWETTWGPEERVHFKTSYRTYSEGDVLVFRQKFVNDEEDLEGMGQRDFQLSLLGGIELDWDRANNRISTSYPSFALNLQEGQGPDGFWSTGCRMAGRPCTSIGR